MSEADQARGENNPAGATPWEPGGRPAVARQRALLGARAIANAFREVEPLWVLAAVVWVHLSYLLWDPSLAWIGLGVAFLPILFRLYRRGYSGVKTPFDLPLLLTLVGGVVGLVVSPSFNLSLGAFQSLLIMAMMYYSIANHPRPARFLQWSLPSFIAVLLVVTFFAFSRGPYSPADINPISARVFELAQHGPQLPKIPSQPRIALETTNGMALALLIAAAIVAGLAAFGPRRWLRAILALGAVFFASVMLLFTQSSLVKFLTLGPIKGRMHLWQDTIPMLKDSPVAGLGLGAWGYVYNSGVVKGPTHPHNAYLELYSNFGILGALAFLVSLGIAIRLGWDMLRSPRSHPWYGLGVGALLAIFLSAVVGLVESAPAGIPLLGTKALFYIISPVPWFLLALLVLAHRLLVTGEDTLRRAKR